MIFPTSRRINRGNTKMPEVGHANTSKDYIVIPIKSNFSQYTVYKKSLFISVASHAIENEIH